MPTTQLNLTVPENTPLAHDLGSPTVTHAIIGGADAAKFTLHPTTGALAFTVAPDFENPGDANGDNIYEVVTQTTVAGIALTPRRHLVTVTDVVGA
jgi:hypothetical protein